MILRFLQTIVIMLTCLPIATAATLTSPLTDMMNAYDTAVWIKSDGWSNGGQFQVGWRADHLSFAGSLLTLKLDNQPTCSTTPLACSNQPFASGEYKTINMASYGKFTFRAKAAAASGVITGLFTYTGPSDNQAHDEIDIEFLGKNTQQVQFNYFVNGVGGHEKLVTLGFDASAAFHSYTIEWLHSMINWYVDGILKYTVHAATGVALPGLPQHVFMNLWAATGVNGWSGVFNYTNPITAQIDNFTYTPADTTPPVITLIGGNSNVIQGQNFNDAGASALDNIDGNITANITVNNSVNTSVIGIYHVTYDVVDAAGNAATQVIRTVNVVADQPPAITLIGATPVTLVQGAIYHDGGATALDDVDGNVTGNIIILNHVNTAIVGSYTVTYNVSDAAGNAAIQAVRTVHVIPVGGTAIRGNTVQVPLTGSAGDVEITSAGEVISNFTSVPKNGSPPAGMTTPLGVLSYTTTVPTGSLKHTVTLNFSKPLPANFVVYKVDNTGAYSIIPNGAGVNQWILVNATSIALTLSDGGPFDLGGSVPDGSIIDPVAVAIPSGSVVSIATAPAGNGGCTINQSAPFDPLMLLLLVFSTGFLIWPDKVIATFEKK